MTKQIDFAQAYADVLKSGLVDDIILQKHVQEYGKIDKILPKSASFFYIVDLAMGKYRFLGKQQQNISDIPNEELVKLGIECFLQRIHPDEVEIIINEVYKDFTVWLTSTKDKLNHIDIVFKYNYRFLNGDNVFINMMEHIHVLEVDKDYRASLLLGNVITTENNQLLPIRSVMEVYRKDEVVETLYAKTYSNAISKHNIIKRERDILRNLASGKTSSQNPIPPER